MIAPVKKSVNHPKTVASMRGTGWEKNKFVLAARQCEVKLLLVPLVVGFFVLFRGNVELTAQTDTPFKTLKGEMVTTLNQQHIPI